MKRWKHTKLVLLKLTESDDEGRPRKAEIYYQDDAAHVDTAGAELATAFVDPRAFTKRGPA